MRSSSASSSIGRVYVTVTIQSIQFTASLRSSRCHNLASLSNKLFGRWFGEGGGEGCVLSAIGPLLSL